MMIYHRDRLIKCFLHVGYQLSPDSRGVGVIGVVRALFVYHVRLVRAFRLTTFFLCVRSAERERAAAHAQQTVLYYGQQLSPARQQPQGSTGQILVPTSLFILFLFLFYLIRDYCLVFSLPR